MSSTDTLDIETKKELSDGEEVSNLLESRGWGIIKPRLDNRIIDLQNINNLDDTKPETLSIQLAARKMASDLLFAWLQSDVYGYAEQQKVNAQSLIEKDDTGFVDRG
jgi:hypothetical protein